MEPRAWRVLTPGSRSDLVLAVDFASTGRRTSSFAELAPRLDPAIALWETLQPPSGPSTRTGSDYVAWWLEDILQSRRRVDAVLGYCAGGVYASALAARIRDAQGAAPKLVLFDPEPPNAPTLLSDFDDILQHMARILSHDEVASAREAARRAQARQTEFAVFGAELVEIYRRAVTAAFSRAGIDDDLTDELIATFADYVAYLAAGRQIDPVPGWSTATAIGSTHPTSGAGHAARLIRFDIPHDDLLRNDDVARAVMGILAATSVDEPRLAIASGAAGARSG